MSDIAERYRGVAASFTERVEGVDGDGWDQPAPPEGWVARDVVIHLVEWIPAFLEGAGGPAIVITADPSTDPVAAWNELDAGIQGLLDDPEMAATEIHHPRAGDHRLDDAIAMFFLGDVFLHTWDLARATGQDETLDPVIVHEMLLGMEPMADMLAASGQYGPRTAVAADADEQTQLLALIGRTV